jgi:hypothetical protein
MNRVGNLTEEKSRVSVSEFPTDVLKPKVAPKIRVESSNFRMMTQLSTSLSPDDTSPFP